MHKHRHIVSSSLACAYRNLLKLGPCDLVIIIYSSPATPVSQTQASKASSQAMHKNAANLLLNSSPGMFLASNNLLHNRSSRAFVCFPVARCDTYVLCTEPSLASSTTRYLTGNQVSSNQTHTASFSVHMLRYALFSKLQHTSLTVTSNLPMLWPRLHDIALHASGSMCQPATYVTHFPNFLKKKKGCPKHLTTAAGAGLGVGLGLGVGAGVACNSV